MTPLYLYALVDERPDGALGKGIARRPLSLVRAGKAWVVVEEAEAGAPSAAALVAHDRVIRRLALTAPAVLPLRFASTAANKVAVRALLAPFADALAAAFDRVRHAVQFTLRVTGAPAKTTPRANAGAGGRGRGRGRGRGPGTRWLEKRVARERVPEISGLTEATAPFVREARVERRDGSARPASRGPILLATVYHLVPRSDVVRWRAAVARSRAELDVSVSVTGPWPPYAFAELA